MIYPNNYEKKIGFDELRRLLRGNCMSALGWERVGEMSFMSDASDINRSLTEVREFRHLKEVEEEVPLEFFFDVRQSVARLKLRGTHLEEQEMYELMRCLQTIEGFQGCITPEREADRAENGVKDTPHKEEDAGGLYPCLWELVRNVNPYHDISVRIDGILDKYGHLKDNASPALFRIRGELRRTAGSISQTLNGILKKAQQEGIVERDVTPTMRDGRLVIPIAPAMKRRINGIVHDESATGKTLFVEPTAVVEANNRVRELEAEEKREVIRILSEVSGEIRPHAEGVLQSMKLLAELDFIQAKAQLAVELNAIEPVVTDRPHIDWINAVHPLLRRSLQKQGKDIVPLNLNLSTDSILIISGPNAGGKSVCLKTVGLLQYMVQCGLSVPIDERSTMGVFRNLMIDIGDEQSIEDDLSTYSSHLQNMKAMIKQADDHTLLLIDEFGAGTEPQIGGALAEAILKQLWMRKTWGIITTHYQNLKHFAEEHPGVVNGAMLYDRHQMQALFQLQIGRPGSSFAIEIARKIGLPEEVISDASEIVGSDYIQSDKYLQDIVRDKRYWEHKRQTVHQREKDIERTITKYESSALEIEQERKAILRRAKEQAEELLKEANRRIENTIREIREAEAEKERTRQLREEMQEFREEVAEIDTKAKDAAIEKKMQQIIARKERREKKKAQAAKDKSAQPAKTTEQQAAPSVDEMPKIAKKLVSGNGEWVQVNGKWKLVLAGGKQGKAAATPTEEQITKSSRMTRNVIDEHRSTFRHEIDVRGYRGDEAVMEVQRFIDDAILMGESQVRILHGKGNGILRQLIRQYLNTVPNVLSCRDEHVQFGGAGITVVEIG